MNSAIVVHPDFDRIWPFAADHFHELWKAQGEVTFLRLAHGDARPLGEILTLPEQITRLVCLNVPVTQNCVTRLSALREAVFSPRLPAELQEALQAAGVRLYSHPTEGFWGQSVAEFGLALTLCGLRRIPQTHHQILTDQSPWNYSPPGNRGEPGARGQQFGDDPNFEIGRAHV